MGEDLRDKFKTYKQEFLTGVTELTQVGWEQHQSIARTMYNRFPEVFKKGGNVMAVSSLAGRCVISMSAFCQELVQCNPKIEIREQSSRFTLDAVVPGDRQNPIKHHYPKDMKPRYEKNRDQFKSSNALNDKAVSQVFTSTDSLPYSPKRIAEHIIELYTSLPSIQHEGMMDGILTDEDIVNQWEEINLGTYSWVFGLQYETIPILQDFIKKADAVISGESDHLADLRFDGHQRCRPRPRGSLRGEERLPELGDLQGLQHPTGVLSR